MDTNKEIERLQDRNLDIQREVSIQLWSSLIIVNGLLLTVLTGISAFQPPADDISKTLLGLIVFGLVISSSVLVWNLVTTKSVYRRIGKVLNSTNLLADVEKKRDINSALTGNKRIIRTERYALVTVVLSITLLLVFVMSSLF